MLQTGRVAQLVEQRIENPRVGSSILPPATSKNKAHRDVGFFYVYTLFTRVGVV